MATQTATLARRTRCEYLHRLHGVHTLLIHCLRCSSKALESVGRESSFGRLLQFPARNDRHSLPALPIELHKLILDAAMQDCDHATSLACALTCAYWFTLCEARLFRVVHLRTPGDIDCICRIEKERGVSFILLHARIVYVEYHCDDPRQYRSTRNRISVVFPALEGLHWGLRPSSTLPSRQQHQAPQSLVDARRNFAFKSLYREYRCFTGMTWLGLRNHVFHSFSDLLRICTSLPALLQLSLHRVSWLHVPDTVPPCPWVSPQWLLRRVNVHECPDIWPLLWLWAYSSSPKLLSVPRMARSDLYRYGQLLGRVYDMSVTDARVAVITLVREELSTVPFQVQPRGVDAYMETFTRTSACVSVCAPFQV